MRSTANSATGIVQTLSDKLEVWKKENSEATLSMLAGSPVACRRDIERLQEALVATEGSPLTPVVASLLADMRGSVVQRMAIEVSGAEPASAEEGAGAGILGVYTRTLDSLHSIPSVVDNLGGDEDRSNQVAAADIAAKLMGARMALTALLQSDNQPAATVVGALDAAVKAHDSFVAAKTKWEKPASPPLSSTIMSAVKDMIAKGLLINAELATAIKDRCALAVSASQKYLKSKYEAAAEVAGGNPRSPAWHGTRP